LSAPDPRAPVIVGAGQFTHRDRADEPEPLELMVAATESAIEDAGPGGAALAAKLGCIAAVESVSWPAGDPGAGLAERLQLSPTQTALSRRGGTGPHELLGAIGERIAQGKLDIALIAGTEAFNPFMRAAREGRAAGWEVPGGEPDWQVGIDRDASHPAEAAAGLIAPVAYYPWFESAVRASAGRSPDEHDAWIAELWGRFAAVARENPYAWQRDAPDAAGIGSGDNGNRMVALPYRKLMTANIQTDQAASLLLCSAQAAQDAGVPRERWVFVEAVATAHDHWFASQRPDLDRSPAIAACASAALGQAGVGIDDVAHLDIYSCFPSAVQISAGELGINLASDTRPPTVTGGLTFGGGPGNNYGTHALAALVAAVRDDPGSRGLSTGVGWYCTKHGVAVLGGEPPRAPFARLNPQDAVDAQPWVEIAGDAEGAAEVEAYTAMFDRDGSASLGIASFRLDAGRAVAKADDADSLAAIASEDIIGREVALDGAGRFRVG
jgi:acetyl-CoA C-acetyltransferase